MKITNKTFFMIILTIIILPLLGNESLNIFLHIEVIATLLNYLIPCLLSIFLLIDIINKKKYPKLNLTLFATLALWIILIISFILSITHQIFNLSNLFKFGCMTFIFLMLKDINFDKKQIKILCYSIIGISVFISLIGIIQYFFQISLNTNGIEKYIGAFGRINSTTYIATILDKYLVLNIFFMLFLLYKKYTNFYVTVSSLLLNLLALVFTFSRAGLLIYIFLILVFIILFFLKKQFINLIIIIFMTIGMYFIPGENFVYSSLAKYLINVGNSISESVKMPFISTATNAILTPFVIDIYDYLDNNKNSNDKDENKNTEQEITNNKNNQINNNDSPNDNGNNNESLKDINIQLVEDVDYSLSSRNYYKEVAKSILKEHWYFGIGIGSYTHLYNNQNVNNYLHHVQYNSPFRYPHNMYYQLGAEIGVFGLILFFFNFIYNLLKISIKQKTIFPTILCISVLLICYTESIFYMKDIAYFTIILIALFCNTSLLKLDNN